MRTGVPAMKMMRMRTKTKTAKGNGMMVEREGDTRKILIMTMMRTSLLKPHRSTFNLTLDISLDPLLVRRS